MKCLLRRPFRTLCALALAALRATTASAAPAAAAPRASTTAAVCRLFLAWKHDSVAFAQRGRAGRDDVIAFRKARGHLDEVLIDEPDFNRLEIGDVALRALVREKHAAAAADVHERGGWDDQRFFAMLDREAHLRIHAR